MDLGCNDGKNSVPLYKCIIQTVTEINPDMQIAIYAVDLFQGNFSTTLTNIKEGLKEFEGKFMLYGCMESFYKTMLPINSVDFCFSNLALYWLSQCPGLSGPRAWLTAEDEGMPYWEQWRERMETDWNNFVTSREKELRVGGRLHVCIDVYEDKMND